MCGYLLVAFLFFSFILGVVCFIAKFPFLTWLDLTNFLLGYLRVAIESFSGVADLIPYCPYGIV